MPEEDQTVHDAYIGVGSNLGDRLGYLRFAADSIQELGSCRCSNVYETTPVGYAPQDDFLNMVICVKTVLGPRELLATLAEIEWRARRERPIRFGPRTLDLDILLYDDRYVCFADLCIPHVRMWGRSFVLVPLADLTPKRRGLGGYTIGEMASRSTREGEVRDVGSLW